MFVYPILPRNVAQDKEAGPQPSNAIFASLFSLCWLGGLICGTFMFLNTWNYKMLNNNIIWNYPSSAQSSQNLRRKKLHDATFSCNEMESVCSSETLLTNYQTTWYSSPKTTVGIFITVKTLSSIVLRCCSTLWAMAFINLTIFIQLWII